MDKLQILGYVAIVVIVVSLISLGLKITGYANQGVVNVTIESIVRINFTISEIDFGAGNVDLGFQNATLDTLGNVTNGNWTPVNQGFEIVNEGNVNVSLELKSNRTADEFIGGVNPSYQYNVSNLKSGSCSDGTISLGVWNDVNTTGNGDRICGVFNFDNNRDAIRVDLKLVIPSDARGKKFDIFTATGTAI